MNSLRYLKYRNPEIYILKSCLLSNFPLDILFFFLKILFIYLRVRERAHTQRQGRDGQRERQKQIPHWAGSSMEAPSQDPEIMTWTEGSCPTDWAKQVPRYSLFLLVSIFLPTLPTSPPSPWQIMYMFPVSMSLSYCVVFLYFVFWVLFVCFRFHIYVNSCGICLSLSDYLSLSMPPWLLCIMWQWIQVRRYL